MEAQRSFIFYSDEDEYSPIFEDIAMLPEPERAKIRLMLGKLAYVDRLAMPYYKPFAGYHEHFGELRIGDFRIFVSEVELSRFILLHIFRKKSNETPRKEIDRALKRLQDWTLRRKRS